ncbi:MAG: bifunctional 23S rRNA (guanine(2069)-N(7))-methyltransferase RlmK/23S rRNA (guanine(2445)-N(2))-methyltransferase RlmL [Pseudomonadota bacterium]
MTEPLHFFAATATHLEALLAEELRGLGAHDIQPQRRGVAFTGTLETAYKVCLWSRLANRVLLPLAHFEAKTPEQLYENIQAIDWRAHFTPEQTLAIDFNTARSRIAHSQFGALKVKDAIVDQQREQCGARSSIDTLRPDIRLNVYLLKNQATLSLDLSGESLHRRGYRSEGGEAPLKENLAAAILLLAGWPEIAKNGGSLFDPMCGSATLLIEGALMAGDVAPGLLRDYFGFNAWKQHDAPLWAALRTEAEARRAAGLGGIPSIRGCDMNAKTIALARENIARAGLSDFIGITTATMQSARPDHLTPGLLVTNPPYGERLGKSADLRLLYRQLGNQLQQSFSAWAAAIFTGTPALMADIGLYGAPPDTLYNGALECKLFIYPPRAAQVSSESATPSPGAEMLINRLRKNLKHLAKWAKRENVSCYRVYDADLPEYALAIDLYQGEERWVHVQEYQAPASVDPAKAAQRLQESLPAICQALEVAPHNLFLKQRRRQKGTAQYEKFDQKEEFHVVSDGRAKCWVNFSDYLDTGLFLDHRLTRQMLGEVAKDTRFLNLFAYTGVATVHAALGGARATTTVDMSNTYLDWARRNLALNGITGDQHRFIQANCLDWIVEAADNPYLRFDLIFLDPPTFSNSKRMTQEFDVQRDHVELLRATVKLLGPGGVLIFSNNHRKFKLDTAALSELNIVGITKQTIPEDFARNPRIHNCWRITR